VIASGPSRLSHAVAEQQAGVAVGIETIAGPNRMRIGAPHHIEPQSADTSMNKVERGRWKIGQHRVDGAEPIAGVMKSAVSPANGASVPSSAAALSIRRSDVEPTAIMRPPLRRTALSAAAVSAPTVPHSACILMRGGVLGLDRQESARPDMQRHPHHVDAVRA